ncbi:MAG: winged helix-turn-helix domain-containing protein [Candidatus Nezhaarchaeales archaeon]
MELREKLKVYRALDNDCRLNILITLSNKPNIAFNDLARETSIEKGLLAYHLGVLKDVGLVESEYKRRSKKISMFRLTAKGKRVISELGLDKVSVNKK